MFRTVRCREGKSPYAQYSVNYADKRGKPKIKSFYVGVEPIDRDKDKKMKDEAIKFRLEYEASRG